MLRVERPDYVGGCIALLQEMERLLFCVGKILVRVTLLQPGVRSQVVGGPKLARGDLVVPSLHLILNKELNWQLPLVEILRHRSLCMDTSCVESCRVILVNASSSLGRTEQFAIVLDGSSLLHHAEQRFVLLLPLTIYFHNRLRSEPHVVISCILELGLARVVDVRHHAEIGLSIVHDVVGLDVDLFDVLVIVVAVGGDVLLATKDARGDPGLRRLVFGGGAARLSVLILVLGVVLDVLQGTFADGSSTFTQI